MSGPGGDGGGGPSSVPWISEVKHLHNILLNELELLYVEGEGKTRVWAGKGSITRTSTDYNPDTGEFEQKTETINVIDAVLSWNNDTSRWEIKVHQTEPDLLKIPIKVTPITDDEGNVVDYTVEYGTQVCSGTMTLYADFPISKEWTGIRYSNPETTEPEYIKGDVTTFMVEKEEKE